MPKLAARLLGAYLATAQVMHYVAAVHRIPNILAKLRPNKPQIRLYHDMVGFPRTWCVILKASGGDTAPLWKSTER